MGSPLKRAKAAEQKFREAKRAADSVRKQGRRAKKGFESYAVDKIADAVGEGQAEVKIGSETISLDTPDKIAKVVQDVLDGKFK